MVRIPQDENPHINFVGLLIGPRGATLKALEQEVKIKFVTLIKIFRLKPRSSFEEKAQSKKEN